MKEKKNLVLVLACLASIVCCVVSGMILKSYFRSENPTVSYSGDGTVSTQTVSLDIYGIRTQPIINVKNHTQVWIVQYKDGYVGLQVKENDPLISQLTQQADSLKNNPQRIVGKLFSTTRDSNTNGFIIGYGEDFAEVAPELARTTYVSLSEFQSGQTNTLLMSGGFFIGAIVILVSGIITRRHIVNAYEEIYAAYPELHNNIDNLYKRANFIDNQLNIIIYKHHLVTNYRIFCAVDLNKVDMVYHHMMTTHNHGLTYYHSYLKISRIDQNKPLSMPIRNIKKATDSKLLTTFEYIHKHFPYIEFGI